MAHIAHPIESFYLMRSLISAACCGWKSLFLKRPSLDPTIFNNDNPVSNIPFMGTFVMKVIDLQLMRTLEEADYVWSDFITGSMIWEFMKLNSTNPTSSWKKLFVIESVSLEWVQGHIFGLSEMRYFSWKVLSYKMDIGYNSSLASTSFSTILPASRMI